MSESAPGRASGNSDVGDKEVSCPSCNRSDFKKEGDMKVHHYQAHGESISRKLVSCAWCNETKEVTAGEVARRERFFCDLECKAEWQSKTWTEKDNPCYDGGKVSVPCDWCGDERQMWPSHADGADYHFCSDTDCESRWRSKNKSGKQSPRWKGGYDPYYGSNWRRQRIKALKRDQYRCQACRVTAADLERSPSVHHITPKRRFDTPETANVLDNLITLCEPCHTKWEGLYLRPDTRGMSE